MPTILHFETIRREGADPTPPAAILETAMPVRSLGRFTVRIDRKGGPVAYLFNVGDELICTAFRETAATRERDARIAALDAQANAIYKAWHAQNEAWNAGDCKGPQPFIAEEFRVICRTLRELKLFRFGGIEQTVEEAVGMWGLEPLTERERNQIRALDFPGECR